MPSSSTLSASVQNSSSSSTASRTICGSRSHMTAQQAGYVWSTRTETALARGAVSSWPSVSML